MLGQAIVRSQAFMPCRGYPGTLALASLHRHPEDTSCILIISAPDRNGTYLKSTAM